MNILLDMHQEWALKMKLFTIEQRARTCMNRLVISGGLLFSLLGTSLSRRGVVF